MNAKTPLCLRLMGPNINRRSVEDPARSGLILEKVRYPAAGIFKLIEAIRNTAGKQGGHDMSCYFRHLKEFFAEAGIEVNSSNRKKVDQAFHKILGVEYKDCSGTWKTLKQELAAEPGKRQELANRLKKALA